MRNTRQGPHDRYFTVAFIRIRRGACARCRENDIPYQLEVMGGRTGTNLDGMTTERGGIKSALISIPQKYMHTGIEVVSVTDIELCARLIAAYILGGDLNA